MEDIAAASNTVIAQPILGNFAKLKLGTIDEVCETVSRSYCKHSLRQHSAMPRASARYHSVSFGTMSFNYLRYGAEVTVKPDCFESFFMLELPLSGCSSIRYENESVDSEGDFGAIVSSQGVVQSRWGADTERLMIQIDREFFERFATNMLGHALSSPLEFRLKLDTSRGIGAGLRAYVMHIARQLTLNPYFLEYSLVERQVENTLLTMLLCGQPNNYSEEITAVAQPGAPSYVVAAYQYINENFQDSISIEDLVEVSGVSMRALYAGFKRYKGVSPMLALKTRRLQAVHEDLINPGCEEHVTQIAFRWGFTHLGNFSRDYRKLYGELPSATLKRRMFP